VLDIAIILPAYNEELTIAATIEAFHKAMPSARIYVVNNNSSDRTVEFASEMMDRLNMTGGIIQEFRQGKGNAMRRAFLEIDADIYVMADADMTYPPDQINELIAPVAEGRADMVNGDRLSAGDYDRENKRPLHNFGNWLVQRLVNYVSKSNIADIMTGYRALSRTFVKTYPVLAEGFQIETEMTIFAALFRFNIVDIPIRYTNRPVGSYSKLRTYRDGMRVLKTIFNLFRYYKPLSFFTLLAVLLAFLGFMLGLPVIWEFFNTGYIQHLPLAVLATGIEVIAVVTFGVGLNLDSIAYHRRLDTEKNIQRHITPRYKKN
jgi:glycosyltransferase involved in cell wall biosynthesis